MAVRRIVVPGRGRPDRRRHRRSAPRWRRCGAGRSGGGIVLGPVPVGREHGRRAARARGARRRSTCAERAHRGRLAGGRGPDDGARAGAAAGARRRAGGHRPGSPDGEESRQPAGCRSPSRSLQGRRRSSRSCWSSGTRALPWLLRQVARTGSRELFTLAVLALALGIAVRLGRAVRRVVRARRVLRRRRAQRVGPVSHQAAADALPLQDAFAVLFFVSVGMLFDPRIVVREPRPCSSACWRSSSSARRSMLRSYRAGVSAFRCRHRAHRGGGARADRRVLVHPGRTRHCARPAAAGGRACCSSPPSCRSR